MITHYPSLNFDLGADIDLQREAIHAFAQTEIAPRAQEIDATNSFPQDLWRKLGDMGLLGITVAEAYGGTGLGYLAQSIAVEEISRASASVGLSYGAHSNLCVNQIYRCGTEAQKQHYLPKPLPRTGSIQTTHGARNSQPTNASLVLITSAGARFPTGLFYWSARARTTDGRACIISNQAGAPGINDSKSTSITALAARLASMKEKKPTISA